MTQFIPQSMVLINIQKIQKVHYLILILLINHYRINLLLWKKIIKKIKKLYN